VSTSDPIVRLRHVSKSFGATVALDDVCLDIHAGEVHVIAGANGAGKSTLIAIISGAERDYQGELSIDGRRHSLESPLDAVRAGIATIFQELSLVGSMSIADNLALGRAERGWQWRSPRAQRSEAVRILADAQIDIDPDERVEALTLAVRQRIEIARALSRRARVLVMDEPTSALGDRASKELLARIAALRDAGTAVVFISHRTGEIDMVADRITVLRDGRVVDSGPASELRGRLIELIAGHAIDTNRPRSASRLDVLLEVRGLTLTDPMRGDRAVLDRVDLSLGRGEMLGIAGLAASGAAELVRALGGGHVSATARVVLDGRELPFPAQPRALIDQKLVWLGGDRKLSAIATLSVLRLASLSSLSRFSRAGWIDGDREMRDVAATTDRLRLIARSLDASVGELSGGNQQKVALARALMAKPAVLLLEDPTRGIDIGTKAEIHRLLGELCDEGVGVMVFSSELDELCQICDRVLVLARGRVVTELRRNELTRTRILDAAMGEHAA
jgi:ABC-type sugar transport system ATPase subunit